MKNIMKKTVDAFVSNASVLALAALAVASALPALAEEPSVQLGAVAQRYPWNGTLDVNYKASGLPASGTNAVLTVTVSGDRIYTQNVTLANGTNSVAFANLPANVKAKDAKVTLKVK